MYSKLVIIETGSLYIIPLVTQPLLTKDKNQLFDDTKYNIH